MSQSLGDKVGAGPEPRHRAFCVALLGGDTGRFSLQKDHCSTHQLEA